MAALVIEYPSTALVESKAGDLSRDAVGMAVASPDDYERAAHLVRAVAAVRREVADTFGPLVKRCHEAHKEALATMARHDKPLAEAEAHLKRIMAAWAAEQERIRQAEQRRLQALAQEQAEAEARSLAEEQALTEAIEAEACGEVVDITERFEDVLASQPVTAAPVILPAATPHVAGISSRQTWKAECTDLMALVRAVAAGQVPITALQANTVFLGQQARSMRSLLRYPGVRVWAEDSVVAVRAR